MRSLCQNSFTVYPCSTKSSHTQDINEWARLYCNRTLFTKKNGGWPALTLGKSCADTSFMIIFSTLATQKDLLRSFNAAEVKLRTQSNWFGNAWDKQTWIWSRNLLNCFYLHKGKWDLKILSKLFKATAIKWRAIWAPTPSAHVCCSHSTWPRVSCERFAVFFMLGRLITGKPLNQPEMTPFHIMSPICL